MKIAVSGSTGLVGSALLSLLTAAGHDVLRMVRKEPQGRDILWNATTGEFAASRMERVDAVVHLAGENIAEGRWNAAKKARIRASRVEATQFLCECFSKLPNPPRTLVAASAIGFYGNRGDEVCTESSEAGTGFLAEVCDDWEGATKPAADAGIRVVNLRIGVVLSRKGGALAKMLLPFKLGGGGIVGSGRQYWSWISLDDVVSAIRHALMTDSLLGPVNAVAPNPATNREFTKTLGRVLRRPTIIPMPAIIARLMLGEMANDLLLSSTRVAPKRLSETGFEFQHPSLEETLRDLLGK